MTSQSSINLISMLYIPPRGLNSEIICYKKDFLNYCFEILNDSSVGSSIEVIYETENKIIKRVIKKIDLKKYTDFKLEKYKFLYY